MSETIIHQDRLEFGSKYIDLKVNSEGVAIVTIRTNENQKTPGETTQLYRQIAEQLQNLANQRQQKVEQRFSTRNQNMKNWVTTTGAEMGFQDFRDDGRVLRAIKIYSPQ